MGVACGGTVCQPAASQPFVVVTHMTVACEIAEIRFMYNASMEFNVGKWCNYNTRSSSIGVIYLIKIIAHYCAHDKCVIIYIYSMEQT